MRRRFALVLAAVVAALAGASSVQAAVTCTYSAGQARVSVSMSASSDRVTLSRSGKRIRAVGTGFSGNCGAATVRNTNSIRVTVSAAGTQTVTISLAGGPFAPGKRAESSGTSEIEFSVNLGDGSDTLELVGGSKADRFRLGSAGAKLNGDGDRDLTAAGVEGWTVDGRGRNDRISAAGGQGTGGPFTGSVTINGGSGNDSLRGGSGGDLLFGNAGRDAVNGGPGGDSVFGGAGPDTLRDTDSASDSLYGGSYTAVESCGVSDNDTIVSKSSASDTVFGGSFNATPGGCDDGRDHITVTATGAPDTVYGGSFNVGGSGSDGGDTLILKAPPPSRSSVGTSTPEEGRAASTAGTGSRAP